MNQNVDSYYVHSELVDLETPNLLNSSQVLRRISLIPTNSLSNSNDTPTLGANKAPQLQRVRSTSSICISNSSKDSPALNVNRNSSNIKIYQLTVHEDMKTYRVKVSWRAIWVGDHRIFTICFFKPITWTWIFIEYCRTLLLKQQQKNISKNCKSPKKYLELAAAKVKCWKKEKEKRIMRNTDTTKINIFLFCLIYIEAFIFCWKTYWEKFSLYYYICITVFSQGRLLKIQ